ncbi:SDR family NAD(P)-dependent oxidoreductase [Marivibrio halodurans]|uniref:SDR family NAD(P)-dependent oxidoreductase n=3 Tax=Marivibrio halodurans TaxID=2039722 RepID=A0A8J7V0S9_9PROT|nr:SDR family NAD(P)-dependent oxidoreductase [Marivibrio halodurans]
MRRAPRHILITGASGGLGAALARAYAAPGIRLTLGARRRDKLVEVASECEAAGAAVALQAVDVTNASATRAWIEAADDAAPLDLVIANAGISAGTGGDTGETEAQARAILAVNLTGVLNTIHPAVDRMRAGDPERQGAANKGGQIAIVSSLAGYRGFPGAPAYSASKAAVMAYGEALRGDLTAEGIAVTVICPGFVRTPMTAVNDFPMPFLMEADAAARIIRRGLSSDRALITFPWPMRAMGWLLRVLPSGLVTRLLSRMPKKGAG